MVQRSRTEQGAEVSTRKFFIALGVILVVIAAFALYLWL